MELWKGILLKLLQNEDAEVFFPQLYNVKTVLNQECYRILERIKRILENDDFNDKECCMKIEEIIREFDELGGLNSSRHDFG